MKKFFVCFGFGVCCLAARGQTRPALTTPQQAVLLELAGSYYYVVKYATIDLDSSIVAASRSLGISLLPLMTEAIPEDIPPTLSAWVARSDPKTGKFELSSLKGIAQLQLQYLLGSWYAFQSTDHPGGMDSAITHLSRARAEAIKLHADSWAGKCSALLGKAYMGKNDTVSGNAWFRQAITEYQQTADRRGEAMVWRYWGVYFPLLPAAAPERIEHLKKADALCTGRENDPVRINLLMHIGYQCFSIGRMTDAQANFEAASRLEDSLHWPYTHYTTDLLAVSAKGRARADEELRFALQSVKAAERTGDSLCWATFYYRLATIYLHSPAFINEYIYWNKKTIDRLLVSDGALLAYQYAMVLCDELKEAHRINEMAALIGRIERRYPPENTMDSFYDYLLLRKNAVCTGDTVAEMKYALLACSKGARVEATRLFLRGQCNYVMGFAWFDRGDYKRAEPQLRACLESPWGQSQYGDVQAVYWRLLRIDTATGHWIAAARDFHRFWILDSTSFSATQARQMQLLKVQYEVDEKEKNILLLQTQTRLQQHQLRQATLIRAVDIGGIVVLLLISALLYNRYRLKKRSNRQLTVQKIEIDMQNTQLQTLVNEKEGLLAIKDWLMKELNRRVGNDLHFIMSVQNMQANTLNSKEALNAITQSNNRLYAMSLIHQKLYQPGSEGSIQMGRYIGDLAAHLSDALSPGNYIKLETRVESVELDVSQTVPLGFILNEAITNAYKHAFKTIPPGSDDAACPHIGISLRTIGDGQLEVVVMDNGKGFPSDFGQSKQTSPGFVLMEMLTTQLRGTLTILNENGLTVRLRFPAQL